VIVGRAQSCLLGALLCLLLPARLMPQDGTEKKPEAPNAETSKASSKPVLAEATRVSTSDAVKSAAQKKAGASAPNEAASEPADSAVTEFHPATETPETSGSADPAKTAKKPASKNIHGTVHGGLGPGEQGARRSGASVGASSKSGKSSIYVETNRSRESQPTAK